MNNNDISFSRGKLIFRLKLYDILMGLLIITSLAFYDIKLIFLGFQLITFAVAFFRILYKGIRPQTWRFLCWLLVFCLYGALSLIWKSSANSTGLSVTISVLQVGLIAFCIIDYCVDWVNLKRVINCFLLACVALCARFVILVPVSLWGQGDRFSKDTIFGSNTPAIVLAYGAILALWMIIEKKYSGKKSLLLFLYIAAFMFVSMMAGTRKGIVCFFVALTVMLLMKAKNPISLLKKIILISAILIGVYIAIMNIPILYGSIGYRMESMIARFFGGEADKSAIGRSNMLEDAFNVFRQHPIFGVGQDGYRYVNSYSFTYSHNNYVEILANLGILGFGIFYSLYIWLFCQSKRANKSGMLSMCILIVTLVMDYGSVGYAIESTYVLLGIGFSAVECLGKKEGKNHYAK